MSYFSRGHRDHRLTGVTKEDGNLVGDPATTIHLSAPDLALRWSVTVGHLANMRSAATGPAYLKLGGRVLYRLIDVEDYEERSRVTGSAA